MSKLNNAEKIARYVVKHGNQAINIHEIPRTQFWLVAEKKTNDTWKLLICNPFGTTHRLVTPEPISTEAYANLWVDMTKADIENRRNLTTTAHAYGKYVLSYLKHNNKETIYAKDLHRNRRPRKSSSTRHASHGKNKQVALP